MILYIEYVILDNMVVNYLLLSLIGITTKCKLNRFRKFLSSAIGTLFAIFLPYILKIKWLILIYKLLCSLLMVLFIKKYKTIRNYFWCLGLLFFYTFLFGGFLIATLSLLGVEYNMTGILLYNFEIPISVFLIVLYIIYLIIKKTIFVFSKQLKANNFIREITLIDNNEKVEGVGYFDSGNMICKSGHAVNIISSELFFKLYRDYPIDKLLLNSIDNNVLKDASYIEINSLSKGQKYLSFRIDKLVIESTEYDNVYMAVAFKKFENFDCILNSKFVGGKL